MTLRAGHVHVRAGQREVREGVVIKGGWIPGAGVVAGLARGWESGLRVGGIVGLVKVGQVAAYAGRRSIGELPARMARRAVQRGMRSRQREPGELQVVKPRAHPVVHGVALFAGGGEIQRDVIQPARPGVQVILLVAGVTRCGQPLELPHRSTGMARIAVERRMRPDQRESVQVLIDLLQRDVPTLDVMALVTTGAHLSLVNVGVTVRA